MKNILFWLCVLLMSNKTLSHPMPGSVVELSVLDNIIRGEAKMPLIELGNAVGDEKIKDLTAPFFKSYFAEHIRAYASGKLWTTQIQSIGLINGNDANVGYYQEVVVKFTLIPSSIHYLRTFTFNYDVIIHQVVTHSALVIVKQDWNNGIVEENAIAAGLIQLDVPSGNIFPLQVNLKEGSRWKGFLSMFRLGMSHIGEGTDHLLFLLVLLLPAMLLIKEKRWNGFGGMKYSTLHLLKIVTAFTIGHSITLLSGALGWVRLPSQPVEIMIALSILVSAVHAVWPLFPGKETFVAAGFGLIHGLAFATVLSSLDLSASKLALSILGFNLGIEVMQLFVVAVTVPWLILLSKKGIYRSVRTVGALFAGVAATAWIVQRSIGESNLLTQMVEGIASKAPWIGFGLTLFAFSSIFWPNRKKSVVENAKVIQQDHVIH